MRILGHPWHAGHNYELLKLPYEWHYLPGDWHQKKRPFPERVKWVEWDFDPSDYDLILTHASHEGWSYLDRLLPYRDQSPMICIMHGVPESQGQIDTLKHLMDDVMVVCNSWQQEREWGFKRSKTIIHGFDESEWPQTNYKRNEIVTTLPGIDENYPSFGRNYGIAMLNEVRKQVPVTWIGKDKKFRSWEKYKKYMAGASIYFNPTLRSPMPRARGEAMMMGLAAVTTPYYDADRFSACDVWTASDAVLMLKGLLKDRKLTSLMGIRSRTTALKHFSWSRWAKEWQGTISHEIDSFSGRRSRLGSGQLHQGDDRTHARI